VKVGVGVYGKCAGEEHVEVGVDGVVFECDEGMRPWNGFGSEWDGVGGWNEAGIEGNEGNGALGGLGDGVVELEATGPLDLE
jgi:hypothetical protein